MNVELLKTDNGSVLNAAVRLEASNWKGVSSAYADAAAHIAMLFAADDTSGIHLYMADAQDRTTDPAVWNRVCTSLFRGARNALASLPEPLTMTGTRDFRPTHRGRNPLFTVALTSDVKAQRKAAADAAAEQAAEIEQRAAAERAAEQAAADASVTEKDILTAALSEIDRLGLSRAVFFRLAVELDESGMVKAMLEAAA